MPVTIGLIVEYERPAHRPATPAAACAFNVPPRQVFYDDPTVWSSSSIPNSVIASATFLSAPALTTTEVGPSGSPRYRAALDARSLFSISGVLTLSTSWISACASVPACSQRFSAFVTEAGMPALLCLANRVSKCSTRSPCFAAPSIERGVTRKRYSSGPCCSHRSEEHTSELQSPKDLVCR